MQVIYSGKTKASLPRGFDFPPGFCLTQNPKHWSNEEETLKLINEIIVPYIKKKRAELKLAEDQKAWLWDVFRGQMTEKVKEAFSLNIETVYVPANMTTTRPYSEWIWKEFHEETIYSEAMKQPLESGTPLEDIEVDLRLFVIKA